MKLILLVFFMITTFAFSSEIEDKFIWKEKAPYIDFTGCLIVNNKIICYGTNSSYVISSDKGKSWEQGKIEDVGIIMNIEFIDNTIIGFSHSGFSIKSTDFGNSWIVKKLDYLDKVFDVHYDSDHFFIRGNNSIKVIDKSFNLISEVVDTVLTNNYGNYDPLYPITNKICIVGDYLYFNNLSNKLLSINKFDFIQNKPKYSAVNICDSCTKGISSIAEYNDNIYFVIYKEIQSNYDNVYYYEFNTILKTFKQISSKEYSKYYIPYHKIDKDIFKSKNIVPSKFNFTYFQLSFDKYNKEIDTFEHIGVSKIIPSPIKYDVKDIKKINDSSYIAVATNKTILISNNNGKEWETVSTIPNDFIGLYPTLIKDTLEMYNNGVYDSFLSYDNGITYKPNEYNYNDIIFTNTGGLGLLSNYIESSGKEISINNNLEQGVPNIFISDNYCKSYIAKSIEQIKYSLVTYTYFNRVNDKMISIFNIIPLNTSSKYKNYFKLCKYDTNMNLISTSVDSINYINYAVFKNENNGFAVSSFSDSLEGRIEILNWNSINKKWDRGKNQKVKYSNVDVFDIGNSRDSVLIVCRNKNYNTVSTTIYIYDNKSKTFESIYENTENGEPKYLLKYGNKMLLVGRNFFMENNDRSNLKSWKKIKITDGSDWTWSRVSADSNYYQVMYSSPSKPKAMYKIYLNPNLSIENTEDQTYFYSYPTYPLPAMNELKSLIYWDMSYNIDNSDIGVYDIYGNKIANREKISINKLNAYSGYLTWDCSGASTGIYMIQIKHGTNTHNIRAMVVR